MFQKSFEGSDQYYLADPKKITIKKNGGTRWGVLKESKLPLSQAIEAHLNGTPVTDEYGSTGKRGLVLPPIRKSDNKCKWGAIDVDGNIYKDNGFKRDLLNKIKDLDLPLLPCFSKSKGIHIYIRFKEWTDAQKVIDILTTILIKLELPLDTEKFPKQAKVDGTGNGVMLPYMHGVGNDWIKKYDEKEFYTGTREEFEEMFDVLDVNAEDIKIELPAEVNTDTNGSTKKSTEYSRFEIIKKIKDGTIEQCPGIGGKYHNWIQIVIAKGIVDNCDDQHILDLIKKVHKDGWTETWPESYQKMIDYARKRPKIEEHRKDLEQSNALKDLVKEEEKKKDEEVVKDIGTTLCYVRANDMFNELGTIEFLQAKQINNYNQHKIKKGNVTEKLLKDPEFSKAETFITSAKYAPGLMDITRPGIIPLINKGTVLNIYIPNYLTEKKGDIKWIIDFYIWLIGEKKWKIIEQWIAYLLQHPGEKIKWSIVLVSDIEGAGKGLLARIISRILGTDNVNENANYKHMTNTHNTLLIGKQVVVLNEVSLGDFKSKAEGTNTLKNFVADDFYTCNFKGRPMVILPNLTNIMLFSQDPRVIQANKGVRRYYFCNINKLEEEIIKKTNEGFFQRAWDFADSDEGASALMYYFKKEVVIPDPSIFKKRAPVTDDLEQLIEETKHPVQKKLEADLKIHKKRIFRGDWSGLMTFDELNEKMNTTIRDEFERYDWGSWGDDALYKFLSANCIRWNNGEATRQIKIKGIKHRFYLLDDSNCPVTNKSYKDLTPKQIEIIHQNYSRVVREIENEEEDYLEAKENLPGWIKLFKETISFWIDLAAGKKSKWTLKKEGPAGYGKGKLIKNKTVEQAYKEIMDGTIELLGDDKIDRNKIKLMEFKVARGIRTPEQIIADIPLGDAEYQIKHKGEFTPKMESFSL